MPYGSDITEPIPYVLSNPANSTTYASTREAYDVAVAGLPFFLMNSDDSPYRRVTAQYRKQQIDQTREAGERAQMYGLEDRLPCSMTQPASMLDLLLLS